MAPVIMDGSSVAKTILAAAKKRAEEFATQTGSPPCLATILVGDDPASATYVKMKQNRCRDSSIESRHVELGTATTTAELVDVVSGLSADPGVHGILLQHPVPHHIDERACFEAISPDKDVDGVTLYSFAKMAFGLPGFDSCTPGGIIRLIDSYDIDLAGKHAVVVGRSPILGKPVGMLLLARDATVTYCHSKTVDIDQIVGQADVVVAAVGKAGFVKGEWIKGGAVVIDAGSNPGNIGDVAFDAACQKASFITPVPGGVGPMTIAVLLDQTVDAAFNGLEGR